MAILHLFVGFLCVILEPPLIYSDAGVAIIFAIDIRSRLGLAKGMLSGVNHADAILVWT